MSCSPAAAASKRVEPKRFGLLSRASRGGCACSHGLTSFPPRHHHHHHHHLTLTMSIPQQQHTIAPPSYTPAAPANKKGYSAIPQTDAEGSAAPAGYAAPEYGFDPEAPRTEGDAESDDFKYGVTVDQCSAEIRMQFLKKVSGLSKEGRSRDA